MKRNVLRITLALVLAMILLIGSVSTVSASKNPAYIRLSGHPVAGELEFFVGCRHADTAVGIYGFEIWEVTNTTLVTTAWYDLPADIYSFQSPVFAYTDITAPGKYRIDFFLRSSVDGKLIQIDYRSKTFKIR